MKGLPCPETISPSGKNSWWLLWVFFGVGDDWDLILGSEHYTYDSSFIMVVFCISCWTQKQICCQGYPEKNPSTLPSDTIEKKM